MSKFALFAAFALVCASCASRSQAPAAESAVSPPATEQTQPTGASEVLREGKKCPKHATLVDGKCRLDVESDD